MKQKDLYSELDPVHGISIKIFHIIDATINSRCKIVSTKSPTGIMLDSEFIQFFFRYLKNAVTDKYRKYIKDSGPYKAIIEYEVMSIHDSLRLRINDFDAIPPLACWRYTLECVVSILIYMDIDYIQVLYQLSAPIDIGTIIDFWAQCEDYDILEYLLESKFIDDPGDICTKMIEINTRYGRGENVMRLLRWKHENLCYDESTMRL